MEMPEPKSMEGAQILIWVLSVALGSVSAAALWFLKRYFKSQDEETEAVKHKLKSHETKMSHFTDSIGANAEKIRDEMVAFKSSNLDFQRQVNQNIAELRNSNLEGHKRLNSELADLDKHVTHVEAIMDRTREKAGELDKKFDRHITQIKEITDHVSSHTKIIRALMEGFKQQKAKLEVHDGEIKKFREEIVNISLVKKKPDDKP